MSHGATNLISLNVGLLLTVVVAADVVVGVHQVAP